MAREIKTSLIVDGEQAFKRSINEANTSMKNLGTQLTLAQAQFKRDGDAMKLMETRSKALKGEISQQEEIVKALEKAVKDSSEAYGENSAKTEKWEADLNRAKAKLANLQNELTLNEQGLDRNGKAFDESSQSAADYQATLEGIGKNVSFEAITSGIHGITGVIEGAIKKVFSFAKAIRETFADAGEWADQLMTDSIKYRMDPEELQRWQYAAKIIDTDVETIYSAQDKLSKKVKNGWKDGNINMWEMLGIDLTDSTGNQREALDIMFDLGETLMSMTKIDGNDIRADAYAMEVFGKSWRDLLPLFTAGRAAWDAAKQDAEVVSNERVANLTALDDANQALENAWDVSKYSFLAELAPTVTDVTNAVTEMLKAFNEWMDTDEGRQAMEDLSGAIQELFSGLKDVSFKDAIDAVAGAINGIKDALLWLDEHKQDVFTALEVIAGGFALLKVTELALNIGKIVSGFQTLWAGAKNPLPSLPGTGTNGTPTTGTDTTGTDTTGTDTTTTGGGDVGTAAGGAGLLAAIKNWLNGKSLSVSSWANAFNLTNAGFVSDWFFHNTETGRSINPEYGNSFSFENLWNGFWRSINEKIEENLAADEAYATGETWNILDPASKERHEKWQAQKEQDAAAREWYSENVTPETTLTPEEWENMGKVERDLWMKTHPLPTQEEINQAYLNGTATWNAMPGSSQPAAEETAELSPYEILQQIGGEMNDAQVAAAEAWWDAFRADPLGDASDEKWDQLEAAFEGNDDLLERFSDAVDNWFTDFEDQHYLENEDLLSDAVAQMKTNVESGKTVAEKVAGMDIKRFNGLPAELQLAAQRGTASGVSGIRVYLDGATVGRLVAPYVGAALGQSAV